MSQPQHLECDTPDCIHWKDGECIKETSVTIQEHHCVDYEQHVELPTATVTIEVSGGVVQNVYASPDLPDSTSQELPYESVTKEKGKFVRFTLPEVEVWAIVYLRC